MTRIVGILLLAGQEGEMFLASYIEDGILHFKVSCGHQLITFSDPQHRVDTGDLHRSQSSPLIGPYVRDTVLSLVNVREKETLLLRLLCANVNAKLYEISCLHYHSGGGLN